MSSSVTSTIDSGSSRSSNAAANSNFCVEAGIPYSCGPHPPSTSPVSRSATNQEVADNRSPGTGGASGGTTNPAVANASPPTRRSPGAKFGGDAGGSSRTGGVPTSATGHGTYSGREARPTPAPPSPPASSATPAPRSSTSSENHPRTDRLGRTDGKVRQTNEADRLAIRNRAAVEFRCPVMTPDVGLWPSLVQGATLGVWRTPVQIRAARPLIRRAPTAMAAVGALRFPIAPRRAHPSAGRPTGRSCPPIGVGPAAVCW